MKSHPTFFLLTAVGALLLAGCGGTEKPATEQSSPSASDSAAADPADGRPVEITGNDQMKYNITEIRAKPGERLSVTLVNVGTMPKFSMGHNWILLKKGTDATAYVTAASTAATSDYKPEEFSNQIIASTKLLGPNEQDTVTFNAPTEPGEYQYVCSFPGHFQVGMKGVLIVE